MVDPQNHMDPSSVILGLVLGAIVGAAVTYFVTVRISLRRKGDNFRQSKITAGGDVVGRDKTR